ncbi:MAG: sigma-54-dependent Fis family transcriptional regulator [Deltaproteobacteria bacterium]|nr:sigma-54-dependent Fis family transcriptional regulator [Deltaproteobacteria bacterium]MDQ3296698.1 sigma-54 dependent transcriptional regulator [Myxococcota bacterium]
MQPAKILVADDEQNLRRVLVALLKRDGHEVLQAASGLEAIERLADVDVVITDLRMPGADGMEVLRTASKTHPHVPVIMITAYGSVGQAVEAIKAGAFDYIEKPFEQDSIRTIVEKAIGQAAANRIAPRSALYPATEGDAKGRFGLVGHSTEMHSIFTVIERVADTPSTVLITGESGTGKELVAKALHEQSGRKNQPFIKINCAAIPKTLMESELFGYEKGAFTGATSSKPGRFELADCGTLFLDEIGEIPVEMQVKLLRAIQESEFERVGGIKTIKVDVRLITATNRDLELETQRGNFREDLFYRLNVVPLQIPPLRKRTGDIPLLATHIIKKFNERLKTTIGGITDDALAALEQHTWPGNIRELENVLERTILFCKHERIERGDLQLQLPPGANDAIPNLSRTTSSGAMAPLDLDDLDDETTSGELAGTSSGSLKDIVRAETSRVERELIVKALEETGGNVTQAARLLKISRKSLQMKMKELGLRDKDS